MHLKQSNPKCKCGRIFRLFFLPMNRMSAHQPFRRLPLDLVAERMLPFLERVAIIQFCRIIPALFKINSTWKTLVHASLPFYSRPDPAERKYKDFLELRYFTRLNWFTQTPKSHYMKKHVSVDPYNSTLEVVTDSTHIVTLRTDMSSRLSFFDVYDMNCRLICSSQTGSGLHNLQVKNGKAIAVGSKKLELVSFDKEKIVPLSIPTTGPMFGDAVFLDDKSIVAAGEQYLFCLDIERKRALPICSLKNSYELMKLCETTVRNRVLGYRGSTVGMWDTRQSVLCAQFEVKDCNPHFFDVCAGGERSFFVWTRYSIAEYDIRYKGVLRKDCKSAVERVKWTPDFLYAEILDEGILQYLDFDHPAEQFLPDILEPDMPNNFDVTERYLVSVSNNTDQMILSALEF